MLQQANTTETPFAPKEITDFISQPLAVSLSKHL